MITDARFIPNSRVTSMSTPPHHQQQQYHQTNKRQLTGQILDPQVPPPPPSGHQQLPYHNNNNNNNNNLNTTNHNHHQQQLQSYPTNQTSNQAAGYEPVISTPVQHQRPQGYATLAAGPPPPLETRNNNMAAVPTDPQHYQRANTNNIANSNGNSYPIGMQQQQTIPVRSNVNAPPANSRARTHQHHNQQLQHQFPPSHKPQPPSSQNAMPQPYFSEPNYTTNQVNANYHAHGPVLQQPTMDSCVSRSPTLLQQQLDRQRPLPTQHQQQPISAQSLGPSSRPPPQLNGRYINRAIAPPSEDISPISQQNGYEQQQHFANTRPQHRPAPIGQQQQQANAVNHYYHQNHAQQQQQPLAAAANHRGPPTVQQQPLHRAPQMRQLSIDNNSHQLLGNPTPPLTPNAQPPLPPPQSQSHAISSMPTAAMMNDPHIHQHQVPATGPVANYGGPMRQPMATQHKSQSPIGQYRQHQHHIQHHPETSMHNDQAHQTRSAPMMPKSNITHPNAVQYNNHQMQVNQNTMAPCNGNGPSSGMMHRAINNNSAPVEMNQTISRQQPQITSVVDLPSASQCRLTLPLRDSPLLGPFRLDHDAQFTSKIFRMNTHLFDTLSKSLNLSNPRTATVIQELQFRAYMVGSPTHQHNNKSNGGSLLAANQPHHNHQNKACNWPELMQLSVNQQVIHLDRSKSSHKAVDIFQLCHLGENVLDIQVNDCYCSHEFVLEAVDRPTLKAFMNSCFKSRLLSADDCVAKLRCNFGTPGFLVQNSQLQSMGILNEYITLYNHGIEQTKIKISLRCSISARRMRTPTRGHNCKHLQCFDLENFLYLNRDRSQWSCPICLLPIPFNMLELDQLQINITQFVSENMDHNNDDILIDNNGQWQMYHGFRQNTSSSVPPLAPSIPQQQIHQQNASQPLSSPPNSITAKSSGTFHPQPPYTTSESPISSHQSPPMAQLASRPAPSWQPQPPPTQQAVRRMPSTPNSCQSISSPVAPQRSANGSPLAKRPYSGQYASNGSQHPPNGPIQQSSYISENPDELSPLAAMERTIIQHEQQMGPPPFDPNTLASTSPRVTPSTGHANTMMSNSPGPHQVASQNASSSPLQQPSAQINGAYSPATHPISGLAKVHTDSPLHQQAAHPQSPMQQHQSSMSTTTPATLSTLMLQGGPETPATPSNSGGGHQQVQCGPTSVSGIAAGSQSPHVGSNNGPVNIPGMQPSVNVDHQPLSNSSASAGSVTSSSTMTPSGQSLGSVGMGGDSRCNTAPLQSNNTNSLDDLLMPGVNQTGDGSQYNNCIELSDEQHEGQDSEKGEVLMDKLMNPGESLLRDNRNGDITMNLHEAEWNQQLDRSKSEHLANFLNDPLMNRKHQTSEYDKRLDDVSKRMGPNNHNDAASDRTGGHLHEPNLDHLDHYGYLDHDNVDDGAGLPPDDSILDLFER